MPAWSAAAADVGPVEAAWPAEVTRDWAFGGAAGEGVRVCILDSGIEPAHPLVGPVASSVGVAPGDDGQPVVVADELGDVAGHGTACAGIVRSLAPACELHSVRVLGAGNKGSGAILLAGLRHAIEQGYDVVNMSLSTTKAQFTAVLHDLADTAYFQRTVLVASAHNMPVESYPWRFSSVVSVGCHDESDPLTWYYNPSPPVEFFARGLDVEVAWLGGGTLRCSGNSFATPHIAGITALVLSKHPSLTPFQLKSVLSLTASNAR
jgi:subtilisin